MNRSSCTPPSRRCPETFAADGKHWVGDWPEPFRDAHGTAVERFRAENPQKIAFHAWLQWLADRQLESAHTARALAGGMTIGLYRDLAVGVDTAGAELWARPDWFVPGVAVGAPPDLLGPAGQNWGLPPFNPRTLEEQGLQAFRTLVASNMRHAGAIRIDHAFQLQRLYVVPDGLPATEGVYIDYPFAAMLAVLRIESHRARSLVIAEDLGTSPEGFAEAIMGSDILSYRIVNFEREPDGAFKPPAAYPRKALAAIATHDLPTFAGWWKGLDTDLRQTFDVYTAEQAERERGERVGDLVAFSRAAAAAGAQASDAVSVDPPYEAAFRFVGKTASMLAAIQLEDILEDVNQANLPGPDLGHPNWRRKLTRTVDGILAPAGPLARAATATLEEGRDLAAAAPPRLAWPPPSATYRLQFHKDFTFAHATEVLPFLQKLGVSHVYASPILKARPGSTHGYDTVDPTEINPELGGRDGFERFAAAIKAHGLHLLLDIVPNHMGVGGADNPWWLSLLEWGESVAGGGHLRRRLGAPWRARQARRALPRRAVRRGAGKGRPQTCLRQGRRLVRGLALRAQVSDLPAHLSGDPRSRRRRRHGGGGRGHRRAAPRRRGPARARAGARPTAGTTSCRPASG